MGGACWPASPSHPVMIGLLWHICTSGSLALQEWARWGGACIRPLLLTLGGAQSTSWRSGGHATATHCPQAGVLTERARGKTKLFNRKYPQWHINRLITCTKSTEWAARSGFSLVVNMWLMLYLRVKGHCVSAAPVLTCWLQVSSYQTALTASLQDQEMKHLSMSRGLRTPAEHLDSDPQTERLRKEPEN